MPAPRHVGVHDLQASSWATVLVERPSLESFTAGALTITRTALRRLTGSIALDYAAATLDCTFDLDRDLTQESQDE